MHLYSKTPPMAFSPAAHHCVALRSGSPWPSLPILPITLRTIGRPLLPLSHYSHDNHPRSRTEAPATTLDRDCQMLLIPRLPCPSLCLLLLSFLQYTLKILCSALCFMTGKCGGTRRAEYALARAMQATYWFWQSIVFTGIWTFGDYYPCSLTRISSCLLHNTTNAWIYAVRSSYLVFCVMCCLSFHTSIHHGTRRRRVGFPFDLIRDCSFVCITRVFLCSIDGSPCILLTHTPLGIP